MNSRSKYLFKNVGILTISNFASKILVFLLVPLYTSVLTTGEYGTYDLITSTVTLVLPIFTLNIADAVMRFSMDSTYSRENVAKIGLKFTINAISLAWILIALIRVTGIWVTISGLEFFTALFFFFYSFNQFLIQMAKGYEKVSDMGIAGVIGTVTMIGSNAIFLLVFKFGLPGFFISNILAQAIPVFYLSFRLKIIKYLKNLFRCDKALQKEMLIYCIPLITTALGWWVNHSLDKYVVVLMIGIGANGLLSVAYKIPQIINTFQGIFIQAWQISAIKEFGEKDTTTFYGRAFNYINVLMCLVCALLILITKPLGHLLYQKDFYAAWQYVPFLTISCVLNSASGFLGPILSAKKDSKSMAMSAVYGAIANLVMNIIFVYFIGIQGATIATVISSFIIYQVRKKAVKGLICFENYNIVLITWLLLCLQAVIEIYTLFWWIEMVLIMLIVILNRKTVKDILVIGKRLIRFG